MDRRIEQLQVVLQERQRLQRICVYFEGACERSPDWSADDQAAWDQTMARWRDADGQLAQLAEDLRVSAPDVLAAFIAERRRVHEARLLEEHLPDWARRDLTGTIERWERFGRADYPDFYRWVTW